jgi:FAD/FMN-containing dehydrogenase
MQAPTMSGLITNRDPEWSAVTQAWNLSVDQQPAFVVRVNSAAEVAEVVSFARSNGLRVAPQGTGTMPPRSAISPIPSCCGPTCSVR